jgi:hypothetical protein
MHEIYKEKRKKIHEKYIRCMKRGEKEKWRENNEKETSHAQPQEYMSFIKKLP